jgi:hypothetical protein
LGVMVAMRARGSAGPLVNMYVVYRRMMIKLSRTR